MQIKKLREYNADDVAFGKRTFAIFAQAMEAQGIKLGDKEWYELSAEARVAWILVAIGTKSYLADCVAEVLRGMRHKP